MRQVLLRAAFLLRHPLTAAIILILAVGGATLVALPLFEVPGYELGAAMALGVGLLGGLTGIAAAFQERRLIQGRDPRPKNALRMDGATGSAWMAMSGALVFNSALLVVPFLVSLLHGLFSTRCSPFAHAGFYPLLALPSAVIASATGVLCGFATRRWVWAILLYLLLVLASGAITVWPLIQGPQVYAYNHFGGYFPGPLYDEVLQIKPELWWFRLQTLLLGGLIWFLTAFLLDMRQGVLARPHFRPGAVVLLVALGAGVAAIEQRAGQLGIRTTDERAAEVLGGRRETEHFVLHYPRGKKKEDVDRLVRDLEFRHHQLGKFFGGVPAQKIRVWMYRSPEEKERLVGASQTQYAKPWRLETHINDAPFPHPTLKHELAHVLAAPFGTGPFQVTSRSGIYPLVGVIEGLAVAADNPADELTLHEWSAGMRQQRLMPNIRGLMGPEGFYESAPARAYTAAGSFLRYLSETHGSEKLNQLYARGDFAAVYGRPLDALATEWEKFLDAVPLDPTSVNQAFGRFRQKSVFARDCAREVATLKERAQDYLQSDPEQAVETFRRCQTLQPEEPSFRLGESAALSKLDRRGDAYQVLSALINSVKDKPSLEVDAAMALADLTWHMKRTDESVGFLKRVLALQPPPAQERAAHIKLMAASSGNLGAAIWAYLTPGQEDLKLFRLREALQSENNPYAHYLIGRRILQGGAPGLALTYLHRALTQELPPSIRREAIRLKIEAEYLSGDCAAVKTSVGQVPDFGNAYKARVSEWVERCEFEERFFNGPLVPEDPFR